MSFQTDSGESSGTFAPTSAVDPPTGSGDAYAVDCWYYVSADQNASVVIWSDDSLLAAETSYTMQVTSSEDVAWNGRTTPSDSSAVTTTSPITVGNWHHIVGITLLNDSTVHRDIVLVDGVELVSNTISAATNSQNVGTANIFFLENNAASVARCGELRYWPGLRTSSLNSTAKREDFAKTLMAKAHPIQAGEGGEINSIWRFDEGAGTALSNLRQDGPDSTIGTGSFSAESPPLTMLHMEAC